MKVILTPAQLKITRRYFLIKEVLNEIMDRITATYLNTTLGFDNFLHMVSNMAAEYVVNEEEMRPSDDRVTLRNQIKQFIRNHFREEIKEYFLKSIS